MIGATPWQIRFAMLQQQQILVLIGILIGYGLGAVLVPRLLTRLDTILAVYINEMDIFISVFFVCVLVAMAQIKWVIFVGKINPVDLMKEENSSNNNVYRNMPSYSVLFQMSLSNIGRYKKRNVIVICLLTIGLVVLSCVYVVNKSYDINKYMDEIVMSDITITEKSLINSWGDYNPKGKTISSEFVEKLDKTGEYVIAQGISSNTSLDIAQPTYNIGDTVNFNGKTYEVMAIVEAPYPVTEGKVEAGSEFNLSFFIPTSCFQELFPENTPRKLLINVDTDASRYYRKIIKGLDIFSL